MNEWSRTRKRIILAIIILILTVVLGVPMYFLFYRAPTCFDGVQNSGEDGVDCGGSCQLLCTADSLPLITRGDPRVIGVVPGVYEVVALVENPNPSGEVIRARYTFKLYSSSSAVPVKTIEGEIFVPSGETFAVFEGPFEIGSELVPTRAIFEWQADTLVWNKDDSEEPEIIVDSQNLSREDSTPRLEVTMRNLSLENVSNLELVALVYDEDGNIFAASKTFIDSVLPGGSNLAIFSWPRPFAREISRIDILTKILPDRSFLR